MIRIHKPQAPYILRTRGVTERRRNSQRYTRDFNAFMRDIEFNSSIYGHETVKQALRQAQHEKCCYCESKISHVDYGDVEHFRPKGGYQQQFSDPLQQPGYYWLAYDWDNLYLSCTLCNQSYKRNLFPLHDPTTRSRSHKQPLTQEHPLFLDPGNTNPEAYIGFHGDVPYAIQGCLEGTTTITGLGLDREKLNEERRSCLQILKTLYQARRSLPNTPEGNSIKIEISQKLDAAIFPQAPYSAAAKAAIASNFTFVL